LGCLVVVQKYKFFLVPFFSPLVIEDHRYF